MDDGDDVMSRKEKHPQDLFIAAGVFLVAFLAVVLLAAYVFGAG